ncbi:hypothetical protein J6590_041169 [Homalodisca vitripennis]|nr:hypothetical protein J6590_041169 [Homalodisca vitripennis]
MNQEEIHEWLTADESESEFIDQDFIDMVLHRDNLSISEDAAEDDRQHNTADETFNALDSPPNTTSLVIHLKYGWQGKSHPPISSPKLSMTLGESEHIVFHDHYYVFDNHQD